MERGKGRILVLIAEQERLETVCGVLRRAGYTCVGFADPLRALERLGERDVSLLVADADLPLLPGPKVVEAARARGEEMPAILIGSAEAGPAPGVDRLERPVDPRRLLALVRRRLRSTADARRG